MMWPSAINGMVTSATMNFSLKATFPNCKVATRVVETASGHPWASTKVVDGLAHCCPTSLKCSGSTLVSAPESRMTSQDLHVSSLNSSITTRTCWNALVEQSPMQQHTLRSGQIVQHWSSSVHVISNSAQTALWQLQTSSIILTLNGLSELEGWENTVRSSTSKFVVEGSRIWMARTAVVEPAVPELWAVSFVAVLLPVSCFSAIAASVCINLSRKRALLLALRILTIAFSIAVLAFAFVWFAFALAFRKNGLPFSLGFSRCTFALALWFPLYLIHLHGCCTRVSCGVRSHRAKRWGSNVSHDTVSGPCWGNAFMSQDLLAHLSIGCILTHRQLDVALNLLGQNSHQGRQKNVRSYIVTSTPRVLICQSFQILHLFQNGAVSTKNWKLHDGAQQRQAPALRFGHVNRS